MNSMQVKPTSAHRGFSLMELATIVVITGLLAGGMITSQRSLNPQLQCYAKTREQLNRVREAVDRYAKSKDRFPLPAQRNLTVDDNNYGKEVVSLGALGSGSLVGTQGGGAVFGAVPFSTLGLSPQEGIDCWGNKLTYAVTRNLTVPATFNKNTDGAIDVKTGLAANAATFAANAGYVILSHGEDGFGALKANSGGSGPQWCSAANGSTLEAVNCAPTVDATGTKAVIIAATYNNGKDIVTHFDDLVTQRGAPWNGFLYGKCGTANGQNFSSPPTANLCNPGVMPITVSTNASTYTWTCKGDSGGTNQNCSANIVPADCTLPWGGTLIDGQSILAYSAVNAPDCSLVAISRTCNNGVLSGSNTYQYGSCTVPASCPLPWGGTLADGQSVTAYSVTSAADCTTVSTTRTCNNGVLSGSNTYQYGSCSGFASCSYSGWVAFGGNCGANYSATISHGQTATITNTVAGYAGNRQVICNNGVWQLNAADTCVPNGCTLPWGGSLAEGGSVTAYSSTTSSNCSSISITRTCTGGVLSGSSSYQYGSCSAGASCPLPWGGNLADGQSVTAYSASTSSNCAGISTTRTCNNGTLSGSSTYQYGSCGAPASCPLPWGGNIADGASVTAYSTSTSSNCAGNSEIRNCNNGTLSGSYPYGSCSAGASCPLPWGGNIADGASVTAYSTNSSSNCAGNSQTRTCNNGTLSGSYTYSSCSAPAPCVLPWGGNIADGASVTAYSTNLSSNCVGNGQTRTCSNGTLSGSYTYSSCSAPASCTLPWGGNIASGASVTAYSTNSSSNCAGNSQTRTCTNGILSGSYTYDSCSAPVTCKIGGIDYPEFTIAYSVNSVGGPPTMANVEDGPNSSYTAYDFECTSSGWVTGGQIYACQAKFPVNYVWRCVAM